MSYSNKKAPKSYKQIKETSLKENSHKQLKEISSKKIKNNSTDFDFQKNTLGNQFQKNSNKNLENDLVRIKHAFIDLESKIYKIEYKDNNKFNYKCKKR